ncbi:hypothetical protein OG264_39050 (plasmid) [Streptomyces xanthophaeus]|uniref:hypothetical protein n=1 Tax=Streptomyces xanthophaeus TaxID=67385 RepID=UPI002F909A96|nr:hypothetical protein OG264_39050 [Streptomyces xanthophaeus]WST65773.1 hypothetical protein OG605_40045 [Streptomyces xanthophaeus]
MNEHEEMFTADDDSELDAWLKSADQAVLASLESGMDLSAGLAAITGQDAVVTEETRPEPQRADATGRTREHRDRKRRRGGREGHGEGLAGATSGTVHFGDSVNIHGGFGNTGTVFSHAESPGATAQEALAQLRHALQELQGQVSPSLAEDLEAALPYLMHETPPPDAAGLAERVRAVMLVSGIAAQAGAVGYPVLVAVERVLALWR